jgi:phosphomethylpyrimidine synthase
MTQMELARKGDISPQMKYVAQVEQIDEGFICEQVAAGTIIIPANVNHPVNQLCAIGKGTRIKVNANIGTSSDASTFPTELEKLRISIKYGADTVMDLSTGGDIPKVRRSILRESHVPIGTVPIYQAMVEAGEKYASIVEATADDIFKAIEEQAIDGVDFITVHCGVTQTANCIFKEAAACCGCSITRRRLPFGLDDSQ